jgi:hypothetical protein
MVRFGPHWYVDVGDKSGEENRQASGMRHNIMTSMETSGVIDRIS